MRIIGNKFIDGCHFRSNDGLGELFSQIRSKKYASPPVRKNHAYFFQFCRMFIKNILGTLGEESFHGKNFSEYKNSMAEPFLPVAGFFLILGHKSFKTKTT